MLNKAPESPSPPEAAAAEAGRRLISPARLIGGSRAMQELQTLIEKAAVGAATVLIRGESGTGKELAARAIHDRSPRREKPFVKIQCGGLPEALLESELFGFEKGAFTGAVSHKPGRIELAEGGTLFLDEIGDVTPACQVKLLRLLQDREFERLGGTRAVKIDVRFVAATHRDLDALVKSGDFREDLFYRLNVVPIWLPPLRTRREDIAVLARSFCAAFAAANGKGDLQFSDDALRVLRRERWPGNVRQLQNVIERLVILADGRVIEAEDVRREQSFRPSFVTEPNSTAASAVSAAAPPSGKSLDDERREAERRALQRALDRAAGNRSLAARELGVSRRTLYNKLEEYDLIDR